MQSGPDQYLMVAIQDGAYIRLTKAECRWASRLVSRTPGPGQCTQDVGSTHSAPPCIPRGKRFSRLACPDFLPTLSLTARSESQALHALDIPSRRG